MPGPYFGESTTHASSVWWHPDSDSFVYLKRVGTPKMTQAFLYELAAQTSQQLTTHSETVLDVIWRPDGSGFYFITTQQQPKGDLQLLSDGWLLPPFESNTNREI